MKFIVDDDNVKRISIYRVEIIYAGCVEMKSKLFSKNINNIKVLKLTLIEFSFDCNVIKNFFSKLLNL